MLLEEVSPDQRPHRYETHRRLRGPEDRTPYEAFRAGGPRKRRTRKPVARKEVKTVEVDLTSARSLQVIVVLCTGGNPLGSCFLGGTLT